MPAGTYSLTARATDNDGQSTLSAPITITVSSPGLLGKESLPVTDNKTYINSTVTLKLSPNPAHNILRIEWNDLQKNKTQSISIISASGINMSTKQLINPTNFIQLDVSPLANGMYTIKIITGDKVMYKQFVKI